MVLLLVCLALLAINTADCQDRRPTISFITQPEIVTDIGGTIEMKCSVQYAQEFPVVWMKLDQVDRNNDLPITSGEKQHTTSLRSQDFFKQQIIW